MTIGMLMESLGSKAGALDGHFVDSTPFQRADGKVHLGNLMCCGKLSAHGMLQYIFHRVVPTSMASNILSARNIER